MSCYLKHKDAIDNLKHDLEKAGFKNVVISKKQGKQTIESVDAHNKEVDRMRKIAQSVIDKWNNSLGSIGLSGKVATVEITPFKGDRDTGFNYRRELVDVLYDKALLSEIDQKRKDLGIYESKLSFSSYLKQEQEQEEEKERILTESDTRKTEEDIRRAQKEDAERAGVEYDDRYLFSLDNPNQEELEFNVNTLNRVVQFLQEIGVSQRFIPEFLDQYGSVVEGAIAAANFIQGTVDIAEQDRINILEDSSLSDEEKTVKIADFWKKVDSKLPEEAAHFWYRLLKEDSPLKKMLWESHEAALKADKLYKGKYGKLPGINSAQDLTEEAIGQLIAEAIKRIEAKNASNEDYSYFKKFLEWINSILNTFKTIDQDPFEVAAMKILSSDVSDLMTFQEYKNLTDIVYFDTVLDNQSVAPVDYTLIEDIGIPVVPSTNIFGDVNDKYYFVYSGGEDIMNGKQSPKFDTQQELDAWVVANIPQIIQRQEEKNQQIIDNQRFVDRLLNKTFRKRTKFLPKTLRKYFDIIDSRFYPGYPLNKFEPEGAEITRKLSPKEKEVLQQTLGYTNVTPTLKVLPLILQKYKKNPISLSEKLKVDGIKKEESAIIENIKDLIKAENPDKKSITAEELVNEVHTFLETNFMLGFANEEQWLDYRVRSTFEKTDDVLHNKISIRFNDKSHIQKNIKGSTHFARFSYGALPAAWANLTYFYNKSTEKKDAVLLHEIQSDVIEFLRSFNIEDLNLDNLLDTYLYDLSRTLTDNLRAIEDSEIKIDKTRLDHVMHNLFGKSQFSIWLMEHYNQSIDSLYPSFKNFVQEMVDLYESNPYYFISTVQKSIDEAYSKKRRWQDFIKTKKGIKNILTKEELQELKDIIKEANDKIGDLEGMPVTLTDRKMLFKRKSKDILDKINERLLKMYGSGAVINVDFFDIKAKPLPKSVAEQYRVGVRTIMTGPRRGRTVNRYSSDYYEALRLNDNLDFLFFSTEKRISEELSKGILDAKKRMIPALGKNENYKFNKKLLNLTKEKFEELLDNVKFNANLLERAIDLQSQKDLEEKIKQSGIPTNEKIKNDITVVTSEQDGMPVELYFYRTYDALTSTNMEDAINEVKAILSSKETRIEYKNKQYEKLKNEAIQKRNEILEKSEELKEEVRKTLELESGYFTPLLHYVIQKHIKQAGKDAPMYLAGFNITLLTQHNSRTALIYAGKDEINIVDKNAFTFNNQDFYTVKNKNIFYKGSELISQQEYDKAYQQATERRAKEIKYEAAQQIGLLGSEDVLIDPKDLDDSQLEEGIKKLNEYRKKSDQNQDDVIRTIFNISKGPIEPGIIYTSMSKIPGVKLVWQPNIEGIKGKTQGYLVDLTNYNFTQEQEYSPYLYGLEAEKEEPKASIKPGVEELFESNPELADNVYEILGFRKVIDFSNIGDINKFKRDKNTQVISVEDILSKETDPITKKLIEALRPYIKKSSKIYYQDGYKFESEYEPAKKYGGTAATLDGKGNVIIFNKNLLNADTVLHELMHDFLADSINFNKDEILIKELTRIFNKAKENPDLVKKYPYAFENLDEFVSEIFGKKALRQELSYIEDTDLKKTANIFESISNAIKDFLKRTFNFEISTTLLDSIFNAVESNVISRNRITPEQKQKALEVYSQYLEQGGNQQDIDAFEEFVRLEQPIEREKTPEEKINEEIQLIEQEEREDYLAHIEDYLAIETSEDVPLEEKKPVPAETREQAIQDVVVKLKNLLTRLGITVKEFEEIYIEQQNINALTNKLQDTTLSEKERADIESQIQALKDKGLDKRALAVADMMNRTINISVDGKIEDLTEEVLHFIVDIIEQKDPALYKELYDKIWSYEKYKQVKKDYAGRYTTEEEFRKEAITQVLNDYLLNPLEATPESDYQNQKTENFWDKIVNKLNSLFTKTSNVDVNPFKIATEKLLRSDFITASDIQYLNSKGLFFSLRKEASAEEIRDNFLKNAKEMSIKENKDKQPRYFKGSREIAKRVSDLVSKYYGTIFRDNDRKDYAFSEQVREEGVEIHSIFQHTFAKYVSPNGEVLSSPVAANKELKDLTSKYPNIASKVDEVVKEIIKLNPNSYFLTELMISDGYNIGGTLDLVIINKKNARVSIYDWKTKRYQKYDKGLKSYVQRTGIDWWNVNGWRIQLSEYVKILRKNGVTNIGDVRMIPVMTKQKKIDGKWQIDSIEMTSFERSKVDPKKKELLPVIGFEEKSPYETINKITEKMRAVINQNIQRIKSDYRVKADLEEENAILESAYGILLATDNISSALQSLKSLIQNSEELQNQATVEFEKLNDLNDTEIYQYYQRIESNLSKLKIYFEYSPDGVLLFNPLNIIEDIYGKKAEEIIKEHEEDLKEQRENPTEKLKEKIEKQKQAYEISSSLVKINSNLQSVTTNLRKLSDRYFDAYALRKGISRIKDPDLEQNFLGRLANNVRDLYSLNFKTAELAKKILLKADSIIADKNKQATNAIYALRDRFLDGKGVVTNLEDLFKNLIKYDEDKNDYFLVPEISDDFKKEYFETKDKFEKGYYAKGNDFFSSDEYKDIMKWLDQNIDMSEWKKDYEERKEKILKKFEQLNSQLKKDDLEEYQRQYMDKVKQIEYFNDIRVSAKAWNSFKKFKYVNRKKWTSEEYLKLTDIEKEMHKKFTSIYSRAERIGYVQGYQNYYRIPFKLRQSQSFKREINPISAFFNYKDEDIIYQSFTRIDPVTGEEIVEIPVHMTNYLPAKEKGKLIKSLDLFQVYLEFEMNLNRFEELSKVEDILLDIVKLEKNKREEREVNIYGKSTGLKKLKQDTIDILTSTRDTVLKNLIYHKLYGIKYQPDIIRKLPVLKTRFSLKKGYQWVNAYTNALFIQATLKISGAAAISSSIVAGTATSKNIQGSKYLLSVLKRAAPAKLTGSNAGHFREAFNYHLNQKEIAELNLNRIETFKRGLVYSKQYLIDHLRLVDEFIQSSVFDASLEKFLVINNKIVNADTYFSSLITDQDKMSYEEIKEKEAELYKKHEKDTLLNYLQNNTKNGKTDISKLDKDSVYEFEQMIKFESKKIVGNMSDDSIFNARLGFISSTLAKYKTWMPELYNSFFGGIYYREEGKRFEAGRFGSLLRATVPVVSKEEQDGMTEEDKQMVYTAYDYVLSALKLLANVGMFAVNANKNDVIKRLEIKYQTYRKDMEDLGVEKIPTKKEYIDLIMQEAKNARNFLASVTALYFLSNVLAILAGDDDPEDHPYTTRIFELLGIDLEEVDEGVIHVLVSLANEFAGKGLKETLSYFNPVEIQRFLSKIAIPVVGGVAAGFSGLSAFFSLFVGDTENIKDIPDAIPFLRQALRTYVKYTDDEELQDFLNVDKNYRKKEKKEETEVWF